ncbi:MAG: tRNA 2-thiouridine(34) synthase MnmA, partial [Planctomycetota bacterium]|nr:tRNA 2-thiouridine(34) synthase MnmA [Planctomycetota bacterium]
LFMSLGSCLEKMPPKRKACCSIYDARDARNVADLLDINFSVLDFKNEFEQLINYFICEYDAGRTPNPCIKCNQYLKFGKLLEYADKLDADNIATGHYARISKRNNRYLLTKGVDKTKDQSYVLFPLSQQQLSRVLLPLDELNKDEVRKIAREIDLPIKDKLESQDVCFVPGNDYRTLIKERLRGHIKEGKIRNLKDEIIGKHEGYQLFTIGQRHGLGIALGSPAYVTAIIPQTNTIVVGSKDDIYQTTFIADDVNWITLAEDEIKSLKTLKAEIKIRYLHKQAKAEITILDNNTVRVRFETPQPAITPGQAAVFYDNDMVLGGGWIKEIVII